MQATLVQFNPNLPGVWSPFASPVDIYRRAHRDRVLLKVKGSCIYDTPKLHEHARIAMRSGFPVLSKAQVPPYEDTLLIVGAGPSLTDCEALLLERIAAGDAVMAVKGAHDWLMDRGVTPTYAVAADPQPERARCFGQLNDETIYLCATQMHPDAWEYLRGRKVVLWHSETDGDQRNAPDWKGAPLVPGGSTTGLRAIVLAWLLGFRNVELFGYDSTARNGAFRVDGSTLRDGDALIDVWVGEKGFRAPLSMIPQVQCLMATLQMVPTMRVTAHGDGYFQEVLNQGKAHGWPV